jgi:hypothetical protein
MSSRSEARFHQMRREQSHFNERVRERLWPVFGHIDPEQLFTALQENVETGHQYLSYVCRISRDGKRLWRVDVPPSGHFYAVVRHYEGRVYPMTILLPGMKVGREGKSTITLR